MAELLTKLESLDHGIRRITLCREQSLNALSNALRAEILEHLVAIDQDPEARVTILRGAGRAFSAGYDLKADNTQDRPFHTADGLGSWPRHVVEGNFRIWDLAKPVIAQVHGYCLAGGTELAQSCDLIYVADDATIGYPVVRNISPPDNQFFPWMVGMRRAMELMLTGDSMTGTQAAEWGFANRSFPATTLEQEVLRIATRVAHVPSDVQQFNKRSVHRQMEAMGLRTGIRAGTELQALSAQTQSARDFFESVKTEGLGQALDRRDTAFGDYRTEATTGDRSADPPANPDTDRAPDRDREPEDA